MRPYQHAVSSAVIFGGQWNDYVSIHEFIDSTKVACSDIRHRMILHSVDLGGALARMAFPHCDQVDQIVSQHVFEDVGESRTLSSWLEHCQRSSLPRIYPGALPFDPERIITRETTQFGRQYEQQIRQVWSLLGSPMIFAPGFGVEALCIVCNSFGPALVRRLLGPPVEIGGRFFDPALCAERMIYSIYRAVPPMITVVHSLSPSYRGGV